MSQSGYIPNTIRLSLIVVSLFLIYGARAGAQVEFTDSLEEFITRHPNSQIQVFSDALVAPGDAAECGPVIDADNTAPCFPPGSILPGIRFVSPLLAGVGENYNGAAGNDEPALVDGVEGGTFDILFTGAPIIAAAIGPGCFTEGGPCQANATIRVFGNGDVLLGLTQLDVSSFFDDFLGIESSVPITRINISTPVGFFEGVDGVAFAEQLPPTEIPTLSEWGMIAAVGVMLLAGAFYALRRRRIAEGA